MIYQVKYFNENGLRDRANIEAIDFEELTKYLLRNSERFSEVYEVKVMVFGYVERAN